MSVEKRLSPRINISSDALLTILIPEKTFSSNTVRAVSTDLSVSGVRVKCYQLSREDYHWLIKGLNFAKLEMNLPFLDRPVVLKARIVWLEWHDATEKDKPHCILGMKFDKMKAEIEENLQKVVEKLSSQTVKLA